MTIADSSEQTAQSRKSFCRFCIAMCGIDVEVGDGGKPVTIRGDSTHPSSQGYLCFKGRNLLTHHQHPNRINGASMRVGRSMEDVSWELALDDAADRLREVISDHGPDAVAIVHGAAGAFDATGRYLAEQLQRAIGSKSKYSNMTVDTPCRPLVSDLMTGNALLRPALDHDEASLVILIGSNPVVSHGHTNAFPNPVVRLRDLARRADIWVVDPRTTETAQLAHQHLQPQPGSDWALMAYLVRAAIDRNPRIELEVLGLDALRSAVAPIDLARASEITGLATTAIEALDEAIERSGRLAAIAGTGVTMSATANVTEWMVWALTIVTNSFDHPGGVWFNPGFFQELDRRTLKRGTTTGPGPRSRPDLSSIAGELPSGALIDEIESGSVRAVIVTGCNPITSLPDAQRQLLGWRHLEALIVCDVVHTSICDIATHVFGVAGQLERADLSFYAQRLMFDVSAQYTDAVTELEFDRKQQWWVLASLAERLGLSVLPGDLTVEATDADLLAHLARHGRSSFEALRSADGPIQDSVSVFGWVRRYLAENGGCQLAPEPLIQQLEALLGASLEHERLHHRPSELRLVCRRQRRHINAQHISATEARRRDEPTLTIHPIDATTYDIADGEIVEVISNVGKVRAVAELDDSIRPGVVSLPHGFESVNVSTLTSARALDMLSGMVEQTSIVVSIEKVDAP